MGEWRSLQPICWIKQKMRRLIPIFLTKYLQEEGTTIAPDEKDVEGFDEFIKQYQKGLALERVAIDVM